MDTRKFFPGLYTHFKNGSEYIAYEETIAEENLRPRVSYYSLKEPSRKWSRTQDVFLAKAIQNDTNKTGQEFKFELKSYLVPLIMTKPESEETLKFLFKELSVLDVVVVTYKYMRIHVGSISTISNRGIRISTSEDVPFILWEDITELKKYFK